MATKSNIRKFISHGTNGEVLAVVESTDPTLKTTGLIEITKHTKAQEIMDRRDYFKVATNGKLVEKNTAEKQVADQALRDLPPVLPNRKIDTLERNLHMLIAYLEKQGLVPPDFENEGEIVKEENAKPA